MRKKLVFFVLGLVLGVVFTGCDKPQTAQKQTLNVFAAASMSETMSEIKKLYEAKNGVELRYTFDSSGTLLRQILAGSECDVFISAAQKQMNTLEEKGLLLENSRENLLENKVVLAVKKGNPARLYSFAELTSPKLKLLAIGNKDVPVGSYTLDIFAYLNTSDTALASEEKLTFGSNVKEVTTQVAQGVVDAGVIYATDAFLAGLEVVNVATKEMCKPVIYPVATLKASKNSQEAAKFIAFLKTQEAMEIFKKVGFSPAE